jgi:hypothetical protein
MRGCSTGDSGPVVLSLVVGLEESNEGVETEVVDVIPNIGFIRGRFRFGASSSVVSLCEARKRFPNGEFLRPDIGIRGDGDSRFMFLLAVG